MARRVPWWGLAFLLVVLGGPARSEEAPDRLDLGVEEHLLDNGLRLLLLPRPQSPTVAAGWVIRTGSGRDPADVPGLAHLVEHLMFKGTEEVGVGDRSREEELTARIDALEGELARLRREGSEEAAVVEERLAAARRQHREILAPGELSLLLSRAGAEEVDATTFEDLTLFHSLIPASALELWMRLEAGRLGGTVVRELDHERRIVDRERTSRREATPGGELEATIRGLLWPGHPYGRSPLGEAGSLAAVTRDRVERFLERHYRPDLVTVALVGGFDPEVAHRLAGETFGGLEVPASPPLPGLPPPLEPEGERRLAASCRCPPGARILFPTVPAADEDAAAVSVFAGLLSGPAGLLARRFVDPGLAVAASAVHRPLLRAGSLEIELEAAPGVDPGELVAAWDELRETLIREPIPRAEAERAVNQVAAEAVRRLDDPETFLRRLLVADVLRGWEHLEKDPSAIRAVDAGDLDRVADELLRPDRRLVVTVRREGAP